MNRPSATLRIVPASSASCDHLDIVFGSRGAAALCRCQRYRLQPRETFRSSPPEVRATRLRDQAGCGQPGAPTSGLVAYDGVDPVGWCAVTPRSALRGLVRVTRVPWQGRLEDRQDPSVWAVTCVLVRVGHRRRGVGRSLAVAAVEHARAADARAVEAYPMTTTATLPEELHVGTVGMFLAAGLHVVARPTPRRAVMRLDLTETDRR
jgi:predicted N-acetyltransferase YhbS